MIRSLVGRRVAGLIAITFISVALVMDPRLMLLLGLRDGVWVILLRVRIRRLRARVRLVPRRSVRGCVALRLGGKGHVFIAAAG
jgi:hypothetical protein